MIESMSWKELQETLYFEDGSLRDIYITNTDINDWQKWVEHVNAYYNISFYNGKAQCNQSHIDLDVIREFWAGKYDFRSTVTIRIRNIVINAHFFLDSEIENDIQPKEIQSMDDHTTLLSYLKDISNLLGKPILLTEENAIDRVLLTVNPSK